MIRTIMFAVLLALMSAPITTKAGNAAAPHVFFVNIKNGATVKSPVHIEFGVKGMKVAPSGTNKPGTGHFHLLIDTTLTDDQKTLVIPKDEQHLHFGKGQTKANVPLKPGKHTLQIVMGDGNHMPHNPPVVSDVITITVK